MTKSNKFKSAIEHPIFEYISKASSNLQLETYVIGGFVRDYFLKRGTPKDIDIVAVGSGIDLANEVARIFSMKFAFTIKRCSSRNKAPSDPKVALSSRILASNCWSKIMGSCRGRAFRDCL